MPSSKNIYFAVEVSPCGHTSCLAVLFGRDITIQWYAFFSIQENVNIK